MIKITELYKFDINEIKLELKKANREFRFIKVRNLNFDGVINCEGLDPLLFNCKIYELAQCNNEVFKMNEFTGQLDVIDFISRTLSSMNNIILGVLLDLPNNWQVRLIFCSLILLNFEFYLSQSLIPIELNLNPKNRNLCLAPIKHKIIVNSNYIDIKCKPVSDYLIISIKKIEQIVDLISDESELFKMMIKITNLINLIL